MGFFDQNINTATQAPVMIPGMDKLIDPLVSGALDTYNLPFPNYGGRLVAPFTSDQQSAFAKILQNANSPMYQGAFDAGINMAKGAGQPSAEYQSALAGLGAPVNYQSVNASPVNAGMVATRQWGADSLPQYMSPYLQSVVDTTMGELNRQEGKDRAALQARLAGKGAFGDRGTLALSEQARNAEQVKANTLANLYQGGYGQALGQFNTDQSRGLTAATANQGAGLTAGVNNAANALTAGRSNQSTDLAAQTLARQGLGQVAGLDLSNRGLGTQAAGVLGALGAGAQNTNLAGLQALLGSGSLQQQQGQAEDTSAYNQFLRQIGYPQQQVNNLASILYGSPKGTVTQTPAPSDAQTALGLGVGTLGLLGGTGAFGGANGTSGYLSGLGNTLKSLWPFADGGSVRFADGGQIDDEEDDGSDDEPSGAFGMPRDGGDDGQSIDGKGGAASIVIRPMQASARGPVLSGVSQADVDAAAAKATPQALNSSFWAGGIDNPLTALSAGLLSGRNFGEGLGAGLTGAVASVQRTRKDAQAQELARQKQAMQLAALKAKALEGDIKAKNDYLKMVEMEGGKDRRAEADRALKTDLAERKGRIDLQRASISANAPTTLMRDAAAMGLAPGTPEYNQFIEKGALKPIAQVSVNTTEQPFYKGIGEASAKDLTASRDIAADAAKSLQSVETAKDLLNKGIISGTAGNLRLSLARGLSSAGLINGESVANTEAFVSNMGRQTLALVKQLGAGAGISNADREYAEKVAGGNIDLSEAGLRRIIDINERVSRSVIEQHNKKVEPLLADPNMPPYVRGTLQIPMPEKSKVPAVPQTSVPTSAVPPQYRDGQTATNPATGAKMIFRNGKWEAAQ